MLDGDGARLGKRHCSPQAGRELVSLRQECSKEALLSCLTGAGVTVSFFVAAAEVVIALKPPGLFRLSFSALVCDVSFAHSSHRQLWSSDLSCGLADGTNHRRTVTLVS